MTSLFEDPINKIMQMGLQDFEEDNHNFPLICSKFEKNPESMNGNPNKVVDVIKKYFSIPYSSLYDIRNQKSHFDQTIPSQKTQSLLLDYHDILNYMEDYEMTTGLIFGNIDQTVSLINFFRAKNGITKRDFQKGESLSNLQNNSLNFETNIKQTTKLCLILLRESILKSELDLLRIFLNSGCLQLIYVYDPGQDEHQVESNDKISLKDYNKVPNLFFIPMERSYSKLKLYNSFELNEIFQKSVFPMVSQFNPEKVIFKVSFGYSTCKSSFLLNDRALGKILKDLCISSNFNLILNLDFSSHIEKADSNSQNKISFDNISSFSLLSYKILSGATINHLDYEQINNFIFPCNLIKTWNVSELIDFPSKKISNINLPIAHITNSNIINISRANLIDKSNLKLSRNIYKSYQKVQNYFLTDKLFIQLNGTVKEIELTFNHFHIFIGSFSQYFIEYLKDEIQIFILNGYQTKIKELKDNFEIAYNDFDWTSMISNFIVLIDHNYQLKEIINISKLAYDNEEIILQNASLAATDNYFIVAWGKIRSKQEKSNIIFVYNRGKSDKEKWTALRHENLISRSHASMIAYETKSGLNFFSFGGKYDKNYSTSKKKRIENICYDNEKGFTRIFELRFSYHGNLFPITYFDKIKEQIYVFGGKDPDGLQKSFESSKFYAFKVSVDKEIIDLKEIMNEDLRISLNQSNQSTNSNYCRLDDTILYGKNSNIKIYHGSIVTILHHGKSIYQIKFQTLSNYFYMEPKFLGELSTFTLSMKQKSKNLSLNSASIIPFFVHKELKFSENYTKLSSETVDSIENTKIAQYDLIYQNLHIVLMRVTFDHISRFIKLKPVLKERELSLENIHRSFCIYNHFLLGYVDNKLPGSDSYSMIFGAIPNIGPEDFYDVKMQLVKNNHPGTILNANIGMISNNEHVLILGGSIIDNYDKRIFDKIYRLQMNIKFENSGYSGNYIVVENTRNLKSAEENMIYTLAGSYYYACPSFLPRYLYKFNLKLRLIEDILLKYDEDDSSKTLNIQALERKIIFFFCESLIDGEIEFPEPTFYTFNTETNEMEKIKNLKYFPKENYRSDYKKFDRLIFPISNDYVCVLWENSIDDVQNRGSKTRNLHWEYSIIGLSYLFYN